MGEHQEVASTAATGTAVATVTATAAAPDHEELRSKYLKGVQEEHGSVINPLTGEEVDIMGQCVNLQLDTGGDREVGDTDAYREVVAEFAERLSHGTIAWVKLEDGKYQRGLISRVNAEDETAVTYDFHYTAEIVEDNGEKKGKTFVLKDVSRIQVKTRPLLVKGDPAGGKTTFAKQLLTWIVRNEKSRWLVPVMIRTVDLVRNKTLFTDDGRDMIAQYLAIRHAEDGLACFFDNARSEGRLLVILDGFDEAGSLQNALAKDIKEKLCNNVFLVITTRDMGTTFDGPEFHRFRCVRVKELNEVQQRQVIEKRLGAGERAEEFCTQLTLNPALSHMAKNPLLLNLTLAVFESSDLNQEVGLNRGKIYSTALDGMLRNLERSKAAQIPTQENGISDPQAQISAKALRKVLQQVAYLAHTYEERRGQGVGIRDFGRQLISDAIVASNAGEEFTMTHWAQIEELIKNGRLPVMTWFVSEGNDTFRFAHLTFQEFLCAEKCLQESLNDDYFIERWRQFVCPDRPEQIIRQGWWQQTIQMYCDLASSAGATTRSGKGFGTALGEAFLQLEDHPVLELGPKVNDTNILTIASMIHKSELIQGLQLGHSISSYGISAFQALRVGSLQHLHLRRNDIGPQGCKSIAAFLESSGAPLQDLDLVNNIICMGPPKADMPPKSERNPRGHHYASCETDLSGLEALLAAVERHPSLRSVDLRSNFLSREAGRMLVRTVLGNDRLEMVCGIPVRELRERPSSQTELLFENEDEFMGSRYSTDAEPFLGTGGAELLVELLKLYPQKSLRRLVLANQALACDSAGVEQLFEKLGAVVACTRTLEELNVKGFWDCGALAGRALGRQIKDHPSLSKIHVGMGVLDLDMIRAGPELLSLENSRGHDRTGVDRNIRDCGAGILSECVPPSIERLDIRGTGVGAGYKALAQCSHVKEINKISFEAFTESCTTLDLSSTPALSTGAVACVIARTALTPNLKVLDLSHSNLTSKSHIHALAPAVGGGRGIGCNGGCDCRSFAGTNSYLHCQRCDLDFCSTCCMSECPMVALAQAVQSLPHLESLRIANCAFQGGRDGGPVRSHLDVEGYKALGLALSNHQRLTDLDVSRNYFKGPGFPHLAKHIARMPVLVKVKLRDSEPVEFERWLTDESIKLPGDGIYAELLLLSRAIARNANLRHLDLSDVWTFSTPAVTEALVESISGGAYFYNWHDYVLSPCQEPSAEIRQGLLALETLALGGLVLPFAKSQSDAVTCLDFSTESRVRCENIAPLIALMLNYSGSATLVDIDLSNRDFGKATQSVVDAILALHRRGGALHRCNGIDLRPSHKVLSTSCDHGHRQIMPLGIHVIAATAIPNGNIAVLNLSSCGMDAESLGVLLDAMLRRQTVQSLDVSNQPLRERGFQALASFLRLDTKLRNLRAREIGIPTQHSAECLQDFSTALETNVTLVQLEFCEAYFNGSFEHSLKRTLEERRNVVPYPLDAKVCFLLCNRRMPPHLRLPEVEFGFEVSSLFAVKAYSPLFLIFQYCAQARTLRLETTGAREIRREPVAHEMRMFRQEIEGFDEEESLNDDDSSADGSFDEDGWRFEGHGNGMTSASGSESSMSDY